MPDRSRDWFRQAEVDLAHASDARRLGGYYIPTRYANGHPSGAPFEHFGRLQSDQAIEYAGEIIEFVRAQMAGSAVG